MQKILLTLVVQNTKFGDEANLIKAEALDLLGKNCKFISLNEYQKFKDSYMLDFQIILSDGTKAQTLYEQLRISSLIAQPWLIYFNEGESSELIFNKSDASRFANENFSSVIWGHIQIS